MIEFNTVQFNYDSRQNVNKGRIDGMAKANGTAIYTDDIKLPGMAYAKVLRSPYPHARIKNIDTSQAERVAGVLKVVTGQDLSVYQTFGRFVCDIPILATEFVRFAGDRVAAVIAESPEIAEQAVNLIHVDYEPLNAVVDARDALSEDAPVIHHEPWKYANAIVTPEDHPNLQSKMTCGNAARNEVEAALAASPHVFEHVFESSPRHQGYLEPHVCVANVEHDRIHIWTPNKSPYALRTQLAHSLNADPKSIHIYPILIGGDFGGKGSPMEVPLCVCLSKMAGRPVKMRMSYAEDLMSADPSHNSYIKVRLGVNDDHSIQALHVEALWDGGAYAGMKPMGILVGIKEAGTSYRIPTAFMESRIVYTNTVPRGYMRAPGSPQTVFAVESIMDMASRELGIDPIEFRRRNLLRNHDVNPIGMEYVEVRCEETFDAAMEEYCKLPQPQMPSEGNWAYGTGVSIYNRDAHGGITEVAIEPHTNGSITIWIGFPDQGSGQLTVAYNVVSNVLGLPSEYVQIKQAELDQLAFDTGVGASRITITASEALSNACEQFISELKNKCGLPQEYTTKQLVNAVARLADQTAGEWIKMKHDSTKMPHVTSFCVQIARVRVDKDTGEAVVEDLITAVDVAQIINPVSHEAQIEGGIAFGYGDAMLADLEIDAGKVTAANLGEYKLPSVRDLPNLIVRMVEGGEGVGKQNVKPIGELTNPGVGPAIANAIADAVGIRLNSLPLKAEKVYFALHQK